MAKKSGAGDISIGDKVIKQLQGVTDVVGSMGDIKIKTVVTGYSIPGMVNNKTSKVALSLAQVLFKSVDGLGWKSYLVYLLPVFAVVCAILAVIGLKQNLAIIPMGLIGGVIAVAGLYNLYTMNINNLMVKISIAKGLWNTMYAFLFIFVVSIVWFIGDRKS